MPTPTPRLPNIIPPVLEISEIEVLPGDMIQFSFVSQIGHTYRVEYKDDLNAPDWILLGTPIIGTGETHLIQDDTRTSQQRFYRITGNP